MEIEQFGINGCPYIGIFSVVTEGYALLPPGSDANTVKFFEKFFNVKVVKTTIANSSLLGCFGLALGDKIVLPELAEKYEIKQLENSCMKVKQLTKATALGNLAAVNSRYGIASKLLEKQAVNELQKFFSVDFESANIAGTEATGSCIRVTEKGFIVNPNVDEKQFSKLKKMFGVQGMATTANYGDCFVANSVLANRNGALVGFDTSGHELAHIDEGLRGD